MSLITTLVFYIPHLSSIPRWAYIRASHLLHLYLNQENLFRSPIFFLNELQSNMLNLFPQWDTVFIILDR